MVGVVELVAEEKRSPWLEEGAAAKQERSTFSWSHSQHSLNVEALWTAGPGTGTSVAETGAKRQEQLTVPREDEGRVGLAS